MSKDFHSTIELISGAASAQGACAARMLAAQGTRVLIGDLDEQRGQDLARKIAIRRALREAPRDIAKRLARSSCNGRTDQPPSSSAANIASTIEPIELPSVPMRATYSIAIPSKSTSQSASIEPDAHRTEFADRHFVVKIATAPGRQVERDKNLVELRQLAEPSIAFLGLTDARISRDGRWLGPEHLRPVAASTETHPKSPDRGRNRTLSARGRPACRAARFRYRCRPAPSAALCRLVNPVPRPSRRVPCNLAVHCPITLSPRGEGSHSGPAQRPSRGNPR